MGKERVITIHGIKTEGRWQEQVKTVLEPHFKCVPFKYTAYRRLGALKLIQDPWVIFVTVIVIVVLGLINAVQPIWLWLIVAVALLGSYGKSYFRRRALLQDFKTFLDGSMSYGDRPHLIAHSFGTYLAGAVLKKFPNLRFKNIVLTGCVLRRGFRWENLISENPYAYKAVRNEMAKKDWIARLAFLLYGFVPGMGHAGFAGFKKTNLLHDLDTPNVFCRLCVWPNQLGVIHNVKHRELGHSDLFIGPGHAQTFWLPVLWNIEPPEYEEFMEDCTLAALLYNVGDNYRLKEVESDFRTRKWNWANATLEVYVKRQLASIKKLREPDIALDDLVDRTVPLIWRAVERAKAARAANQVNDKYIEALNPKTAVWQAIESFSSRA